MNPYTLIPAVAFLANFFVWTVVLNGRRDSSVKRAYLGLTTPAAAWNLLDYFQWVPVGDFWQQVILRVQPLCWMGIGWCFLNFCYELVGRRRDRWYWVTTVAAWATIPLPLLTRTISTGFERRPWGVAEVHGVLYTPVVLLIVSAPVLFGVGLLLRRRRMTTDRILRAQLGAVIGGIGLVLPMAVLTDLVFPLFGVIEVPDLAASLTAFFALAVYRAVRRHDLLSPQIEEAARDLVERARDGIALLDNQGKIAVANPALRRMLRAVKDDRTGPSGIQQMVDGLREQQSQVGVALDRLRAVAQQKTEQVLELPGHDGPVTVEVAASPVVKRGEQVATLLVVRDVTARRQLERQLWQAQKMEAIGTLAGGVAHDMNNVLGSIMSIASVLRRELAPQPEIKADVKAIVAACKRGRALTRNLLGFAHRSQSEEGEKVPIAVNDLLTQTVELLGRTLPKEVTIEVTPLPRTVVVAGDAGQLIQALVNLCLNAVDAMEERGELTIEARVVDEEGLVGASADAAGWVELSVCDQGPGMDAETQRRAFDPFFTTKPLGKGTGLGLAVVHGIASEHGGVVRLQSERGRGTRATIRLPRSEQPAKRRSATSVTVPAALPQGRTVLIVDDEELVRWSARRALGSLGYAVFEAPDGEAAIELFRAHREQIALVLLDLVMPRLDGEETLRRLREIDRQVPVIISSGFGEEGRRQNLLRLGVDGFVNKPYTIDELSSAIDAVIER